MKKLFYILVLFTGIANAQIVTIPDPNFKNILVNTNCVDTNPLYFDNVGDQSVDTSGDGEIQLSEALAITKLALNNQSLTSLNGIENFINLQELACNSNPLGILDLSALTNLIFVSCNSCQLTSLNLNGMYNLQNVNCQNNLFASLDLGTTAVSSVNGNINPNLTYVNLKNGVISGCMVLIGMPDQCVSFNSCPNLDSICIDDEEIALFEGFFSAALTSYCSFTPGGPYNTITGTVTFDANNNGCDSNDILQPNIRVNINDAAATGASFTNTSGNYAFYIQTGNFTVAPSIENPSWFNFLPASVTIPFASNEDNTIIQNFCLSANGIHPDVEVVIAPLGTAQPGFDCTYKVVFKNKGNQTLSGNVSFYYDDEVFDFVSSSITPTSQSFGTFSYNYTNLLPFENRSFTLILNLNGPTDIPAINTDDQLFFDAAVTPAVGDEFPADNTVQYTQTVVDSLDPNNITCIEGNIVPPSEIGNYLHYIINFKNTGTAAAENIVVRDTINTDQFDVDSLQLLNSSAAVTSRLTGNIAEFIFQNINLHSGGHGNILLKIKSKSTLVQGSSVSKKANIYFDYNAPVETLPENTLFQSMKNPDVQADASISVYPNPTKNSININCSHNIKSIQLYDVQGRLLQTHLIGENKTTLDISNQSNGVYFIKVISDKGIGVQKIVKE
jgi:hypothetical protein